MSFTTITSDDREDKGVTGLADTPGLDTEEMQERFDSLANLAIDTFNTHITELAGTDAAENIGATIPSSIAAGTEKTIQDVINSITDAILEIVYPDEVTTNLADLETGSVSAILLALYAAFFTGTPLTMILRTEDDEILETEDSETIYAERVIV